MDIKSFFLGLGIGIVSVSVLFYVFYSFHLKSINENENILTEIYASALPTARLEPDDSSGSKILDTMTTPEPTIEPTIEPLIEPTSELTPEPTIEPTPEPTSEPTVEPTPEPTPEPTVEPTPEPTPEPTSAPKNTRQPVSVAEPREGYKGIVIPSGSNATSICRTLEAAGVINNSNEFLNYLINNNLTKKIKTGTFYIPDGADFETIVAVLRRQTQ